MTIRVGTFNGNQFDNAKQWRADLLDRMPHLDRLFLQESVHLDAHAFVNDPAVIAAVGKWDAVQHRKGNDDGDANTAILYRPEKGKPTRTVLVDLGKADDTRNRSLCAALFPEGWDGSFHGFPERDQGDNAELIRRLGAWVQGVKEPVHALGADINQIRPARLEAATGLKWRGRKIDGFLGRVRKLGVFKKGFSDHPGVHGLAPSAKHEKPKDKPAAPTKKAPAKKTTASHVKRAETELKAAKRYAVEHGKQERATLIRKALHAVRVITSKPVVWTYPAIAAARRQSHNGPRFRIGLCLQKVRGCYRIGPSASDAATAWARARQKHPTSDPTAIPRGYPIFWTGGSEGHGHIAISAGDGKCWSTDIERGGYFDFVDVALIHERWGLTLAGWAEDLNGVRITPKVAA